MEIGREDAIVWLHGSAGEKYSMCQNKKAYISRRVREEKVLDGVDGGCAPAEKYWLGIIDHNPELLLGEKRKCDYIFIQPFYSSEQHKKKGQLDIGILPSVFSLVQCQWS